MLESWLLQLARKIKQLRISFKVSRRMEELQGLRSLFKLGFPFYPQLMAPNELPLGLQTIILHHKGSQLSGPQQDIPSNIKFLMRSSRNETMPSKNVTTYKEPDSELSMPLLALVLLSNPVILLRHIKQFSKLDGELRVRAVIINQVNSYMTAPIKPTWHIN